MTRIVFKIAVFGVAALTFFSCTKNNKHAGYEFAPNMYQSLPLDPLSQQKGAEFKYNDDNMTMREPVEGTIARGQMPYLISADSLDLASSVQNPVALTDDVLAEGKALYDRFCKHCHNDNGDGQGLVGKKFLGVPKYNSKALKDKSMGHVFHVITYGKGRMRSHASQLNQEERWKITHYVQTLQKQ